MDLIYNGAKPFVDIIFQLWDIGVQTLGAF